MSMPGKSMTLLMGIALVAVACGGAYGSSDPAPIAAPDPRGASAETAADKTTTPDISRLSVPSEPWATDFSIATIDLAEIQGSVPRDAIPAIDDPVFESIDQARTWMNGRAPLIALEIDGDARGYPLAILLWHEIVNDMVGRRPVVVTFCPLCYSAVVYDRILDGSERHFGNTGSLRYSDMVMYDRATESWWQQATGEAMVGELTGAKLEFLAAQVLSLDDFSAAYPDGAVLSRDTGHERPYGSNPMRGYDDADQRPGRIEGAIDGRLSPKERVVTVAAVESESVAFSYVDLAAHGLASEVVDGEPIVVLWHPGTAAAFDGPIVGEGDEIGSAGVFSPIVDGKRLTFERTADFSIIDQETGSRWSVTGVAVDGPLAGQQLDPVTHANHFWFAWAAFTPDTRVWQPPT
jgi:hypothetical protein